MDETLTRFGGRDIDGGSGTMIALSAALHIAAIAAMILVPNLFPPRPQALVSYTVDLVPPNRLGGTNIPGRGAKGNARQGLPPPKVEAPKVDAPKAEPPPVAKAEAPPEPPKAEPPAPPKEPPPAPAPKVEPPKPAPEAKKAEPKPAEAPKDAVSIKKKDAEKKPPAKPEPKKDLKKADEKKENAKKPDTKKEEVQKKEPPKKDEAKKPEAKPADKAEKPTKAEPAKPDAKANPPEASAEEAKQAREKIASELREQQLQDAINRAKANADAKGPDLGGSSALPLSVGPGEGAGGVSMGGEFILYKLMVENRVKSNWAWAGANPSLEVELQFSIADNGDVVDVQVSKSSGDTSFDASAMRAVRAASPLPPPPENFRDQFRQFTLAFVVPKDS